LALSSISAYWSGVAIGMALVWQSAVTTRRVLFTSSLLDAVVTPENFSHPDRNLALELVRATEAAAIRAVPFIGKGDKNGADGAAVDAMRKSAWS